MCEGFLHSAVKQYVKVYNQERPHQELDDELATASTGERPFKASMKAREHLGGLLIYCHGEGRFGLVWLA
jgi:hypothetical protein